MDFKSGFIWASALTLSLLSCGPLTLGDDDGDGFSPPYDCDDSDPDISPGARERCGGDLDEDCDGDIDEGAPLGARPAFLDYDGDGLGLNAPPEERPPWVILSCLPPEGYSAESGDCDDTNPLTYPGAVEICDGEDNDCDQGVDENLDEDGDGLLTCDSPPDCAEGDASTFPGAFEACDGRDNDCDGDIDERPDQDGDGLGPCPTDTTPGDCNDADPDISPQAPERCAPQGMAPVDDDCDGLIDEGLDSDGDGATRCGTADTPPDCADGDPLISPWALEICDGLDNDCDTYADEGFPDGDLDGAPTCIDCDDANPGRGPNRVETCDGLDNDCDAFADEGGACPCQVRTYGGHVYLFCEESAEWQGARSRCQSFGYDLLILETVEENTWVADVAARVIPGEWWMGLTDLAEEGRFEWIDGSAPSFTRWADGEPNSLGEEDCGAIYPDGTWNDKTCETPFFRFICEAPGP